MTFPIEAELEAMTPEQKRLLNLEYRLEVLWNCVSELRDEVSAASLTLQSGAAGKLQEKFVKMLEMLRTAKEETKLTGY